MPTLDYSRLSRQERIDLIGEIWDSIEAEVIPLTAAQEAELGRRLATLDEDLKQGVAWDEIEAELDRRYR
jgi:putative addiction module component (TIGR02574 family)